tara:strand:- start:424 stop:570 length:147 start_codon:yes stop_codon:yes gene_type:complete
MNRVGGIAGMSGDQGAYIPEDMDWNFEGMDMDAFEGIEEYYDQDGNLW